MGLGLGVALEGEDPRVVEAIEHVRKTCDRHGVAPGIHCSGAEAVNARLREGFRYCAMSSELKYMVAGLSAGLASLNWSPAGAAQAATGGQDAVVRY